MNINSILYKNSSSPKSEGPSYSSSNNEYSIIFPSPEVLSSPELSPYPVFDLALQNELSLLDQSIQGLNLFNSNKTKRRFESENSNENSEVNQKLNPLNDMLYLNEFENAWEGYKDPEEPASKKQKTSQENCEVQEMNEN